jgi:dolichol kinase
LEPIYQLTVIACLLVVAAAVSTRGIVVPLLVLLSFVAVILPIRYGLSGWTVLSSCTATILFFTIFFLWGRKMTVKKEKTVEMKWWRIYARPLALVFIPFRVYLGHRSLLYFLGGLCILFLGTDLYRILAGRKMSFAFRKEEFRRFSSMTSFLVAVFIVFLLFPPEVSYLCLTFMIFGDVIAKFTGMGFGRTGIVHGKTLEGSLGFLSGCLFTGFVISSVFQIPFGYLIIGAFCATVVELFSHHVDDNFTVGIITGGCLQALIYFKVLQHPSLALFIS